MSAESKKAAALACLNDLPTTIQRIGIGSGSTIIPFVQALSKRYPTVECIPSSFQSTQLCIEYGLRIVQTSDCTADTVIDVCVDGADEVDTRLNLIKGGGGCHLGEKIVIANGNLFYVIADESKKSRILGEKWKKGVPVEVIPSAFRLVMKSIERMGGVGKLRMAVAKAGPVITDYGNFIIDADFGLIHDPMTLANRLKLLTGVVEVGLFVDMCDRVYFGMNDGRVEMLSK